MSHHREPPRFVPGTSRSGQSPCLDQFRLGVRSLAHGREAVKPRVPRSRRAALTTFGGVTRPGLFDCARSLSCPVHSDMRRPEVRASR